MKKDLNFDVLSDKKCTVCGKPLKARVVELKNSHNITKCYKCYANIRYATLAESKLSKKHGVEVNRECLASHRDAVRL